MIMAEMVVVVSQIFWGFFFLFLLFFFNFLDGCRRGILLNLDLHVGNRATSTAKVSLDGGVLDVVVRDSGLDGILCKHRAVHCIDS